MIFSKFMFGEEARVMRFNGNDWSVVGRSEISNRRAIGSSIKFDSNGTPYIVYIDYDDFYGADSKIYVMKFDGTDWVELGNTEFETYTFSSPSMVFDEDDNIYLAYYELSSYGLLKVIKFDGSDWNDVGTTGFYGEVSEANLSITCDSDGSPYVAFVDKDNSNKATVIKFDGTDWDIVGAGGFSTGEAEFTNILIDENNIPFVVYKDIYNGSRVTVKKYYGGSWESVGFEGLSSGAISNPSILIDKDGKPVISYRNKQDNNMPSVKRFNGSAWETVGTGGFSDGNATFIDMSLDPNGIPFVVYRDGENQNKATVKKFVDGVWEVVGKKGFSSDEVKYTSIAIDNNGYPYVTFSDGGNANKISVSKFDGSNWKPVGSEGFSIGEVAWTSIAIGNDGNPYVIYSDYSSGGQSVVMKFDGSSWVKVGAGYLSNAEGMNNKIVIDKNGVPYVSFTDDFMVTTFVVMKFNGSTWENMKVNNYVPYAAMTGTIALDADGGLYLSSIDASKRAGIVMKYDEDSDAWAFIGEKNFYDGKVETSIIDLVLNSKGVPYVAFSDRDKVGKLTVMKFNGKSWIIVGSAGFSFNSASMPKISIDAQDDIYVAYSSINGVCKKFETQDIVIDTIQGDKELFVGKTYVYSVEYIQDAVYSWQLPSDWIGNSDSNSIFVTAGNSVGEIKVMAVTHCGQSDTVYLEVSSKEFNKNVIQDENTLTAEVSNAIYQWLDCDDDFAPIPNETNQSFTAENNGRYAVAITIDGYTDTSDCFTIKGLGMSHINIASNLKLYPNPNIGSFTLDLGVSLDFTLTIKNLLGQEIVNQSFEKTSMAEVSFNSPTGVYFVEIKIGNEFFVLKAIKE